MKFKPGDYVVRELESKNFPEQYKVVHLRVTGVTPSGRILFAEGPLHHDKGWLSSRFKKVDGPGKVNPLAEYG